MTTTKDIQLEVLIDEFCRYYDEFESQYAESEYHLTGETDVILVTFGITGAGKSATVARLLSGLSAKEFYDLIMSRDGENKKFCTVEDVTIGHKKTSQTVIPRIYTITNGSLRVHIVDMPGFNETDSQKKIIIDVLQKCFLTRVPSAKFLVVADISTLKEPRMTTLMSHYDEPLGQLLGDKYEEGIDHLYFILTKPNGDHARMDEDDVELLTAQGAKDFHKTKKTGTQLLYRMSDRFVIADLERDDGTALLAKIQSMIENDQAEKHKSSAITSFVIDKLEAGANTLHEMCLARVSELTFEQDEILKVVPSLRTSVEDIRTAILADSKEKGSDHKELLIQERDIKAELAAVQSKIEQYAPAKASLQKDLARNREMLQVHNRQCKVFRESFEARDFINFRCDMSDHKRASFGTKGDEYKIQLNANVTSDGSEERVILVLEYEEDDTTLKKHISKNGSLLPNSLDTVKSMAGASVLYNSHTHVNKIGANIGPGDHEGVLSLSIKSKIPFKVYIYSSRPFASLDYFETLVQQFDQHRTDDEMRIEELEKELAALELSHTVNLDTEEVLVPQMAEVQSKIRQSKDELADTIANHQTFCAGISKKVEDVAFAPARALKNMDEVAKISRIDEIFRSNNIETALSAPLTRFKSGFGPIDRAVKELKDRLSVTEQADRKSLIHFIGMAVEKKAEI